VWGVGRGVVLGGVWWGGLGCHTAAKMAEGASLGSIKSAKAKGRNLLVGGSRNLGSCACRRGGRADFLAAGGLT